jgi:transcriptional regulator with XRE-family HTH domain
MKMTSLERFRIRFKLTQIQVASFFGVHVSSVIRWEQGKGEMAPYVTRLVTFIQDSPLDGVIVERVHKRLIAYGPNATLPWLISECYLSQHKPKIKPSVKPAPVEVSA